MIRRDFFRATAVGATALTLPWALQAATRRAEGFTLEKLPYGYDALEPIIDAETMMIHHSKHHQAYVDNLNKALAGQDAWLKMPIEEVVKKVNDVPEALRAAVRNNGGGHWNHDFFWKIMTKPNSSGPTGELKDKLMTNFGDMEGFKKAFIAAAGARFGSGWVWLVRGKVKPLEIISTPNQDNPLMGGGPRPILGVDVWEHAYYLKYRNVRAKYVEAWFGVLNWEAIAKNYELSAA